MKKIFLTIISAAAILTACNQELIESQGQGSLSLDLSCKMNYTAVETRALTDEEIINGLSIDIVRPFDGWKVNYTPFSSIKGKVVELGSGSYTLTASSPVKKDAAFDQPIFEGSKNFDIRVGEVTSISLECTIANVKVDIKLSENFVTELSDYNVTVSNGKGALLWTKSATIDDFVPADDNGKTVYVGRKSGYFTVAPLTVTVDGHRKIDGSSATTTYTINDVAPANNHILCLDANVTGTLGGIKISISDEVNPIQQPIIVPGFEEEPVPGDGPAEGGDDNGDDNTGSGDDNPGTVTPPAESTAPKLVWEANPTYADMVIDDNLDANLVVEAPEGIVSFKVIVDSPQLSETIAAMSSYADDYTSGPAEMDLIADETLIETLAGMELGLPLGSDIVDKTAVPFPLSGLLPLIDMYGPESGTKHKFTLNVTDKKGQTLSQQVVFVTK